MDESTDISCEKELGVGICYFSKRVNDFLTLFLGLISITDASATGMFNGTN